MIGKRVLIAVLALTISTVAHSATVVAPPAPVGAPVMRMIEITAKDSPFFQLDDYKQRLAVAERRLSDPILKHLQAALNENPEITAAMVADGWERTFFKGLGEVQLKQIGNRSLIKLPVNKTSDGALLMGQAMKSMISCGGGNVCFVIVTGALYIKDNAKGGQ